MKRLALTAALVAALFGLGAKEREAQLSTPAVAQWLAGTYEGVTPGNDLQARITPLFSSAIQGHDLFVTVWGKHQKTNVRLNGVIRLEGRGSRIGATYIPHFDVAVSETLPGARSFTQAELDAACSVDLAPSGDGLVGETLPTRCARAIRGALGKWEVFLEPGTIRVRQTETGETLRFRSEGEELTDVGSQKKFKMKV